MFLLTYVSVDHAPLFNALYPQKRFTSFFVVVLFLFCFCFFYHVFRHNFTANFPARTSDVPSLTLLKARASNMLVHLLPSSVYKMAMVLQFQIHVV